MTAKGRDIFGVREFSARAQQYIVTGTLTCIPIWITWILFRFLFGLLSNMGAPIASEFAKSIHETYPKFAAWLVGPWFIRSFAVLLTLIALYLLGWATTLVLGRRLIEGFEGLIGKIPLVKKIYGSVKALLSALQTDHERVDRVVLIDFPSEKTKAIGMVTATFRDVDTGQELAAVYVPTTPNPTSGFLEIVPVEDLISTDWKLDEAMSFIISGGATAPKLISFRRSNVVDPSKKE